MEPSFEFEVNQLIERIESLRATLPLLAESISETAETRRSDFESFLTEKGIVRKENGEKATYVVPPGNLTDFYKFNRALRSAEIARSLVPTSFLVALVSQYDAYLGRLIRVIFHLRHDLVTSSERQLTYSELSGFGTLEEAREYIIEREIESVLRSSHSDQINWLAKKLEMKLTEGLDIWPYFIEMTERRNLFVHADGEVSRQYLNVCKTHGVKLDGVEYCRRLYVSMEYFQNSCDCIFEMGVKLSHVIWRKLQPKAQYREIADNNLYEVCHNLIAVENYPLAITLLTFATDTLKKYSCERIKLLFKIAKAQALKWYGLEEKCLEVLKSEDWSAKGLLFKLSCQVLEDDYENAAQTMRSIGKNGEVSRIDYKTLPLFTKFRKSDLFLSTYEEIFGEKFDGVSEDEVKIELPSGILDAALGRDLEQFGYDARNCIQNGIRKTCIGSNAFPPLEIYVDELGSSLMNIIVTFETSESHGLEQNFVILINIRLLELEERKLQLGCLGALIKDGIPSAKIPSSFTIFYEGIFDEGVIWNELDQALFQLMGKAKAYKEKTVTSFPVWLSL